MSTVKEVLLTGIGWVIAIPLFIAILAFNLAIAFAFIWIFTGWTPW